MVEVNSLKGNQVEIWCNNCGFHRPVSYDEIRRIHQHSKFECGKCESTFFKIKTELPVKMRTITPTLRDELRTILINGFVIKNIDVWDCQGDYGKCPDPIIVDGIPMRLVTGDIPFFWNGKYYIMELKLSKLYCKMSGKDHFIDSRTSIRLRKKQWELLLGGAGILVMVVEPNPYLSRLIKIEARTKKECENLLRMPYRHWIQNNQLPYDVYILNAEQFKTYWEKSLKYRKARSKYVRKHSEYYKTVTLQSINEIIPEVKHQVMYSDFLNGNIVDLILENI